jgi:pimeloyl-ACP methyl ester carboxylesterase
LIEDIKAVVDACKVERFYMWGYSLGGTVGLQIASKVKRTIGAILVGVWFGKLFTPEDTAMALARIEAVERARNEGVFDEMEMVPGEKDFFKQVDTSLRISVALAAYPPIEPAVLCQP